MNIKTKKRIMVLTFIVLVMMLIFNANTVYAEINKDYSGTDSVAPDTVAKALEGSDLIEGLAKLVYALGRFLEWILGTIFNLLTGYTDYPWADKIVFNSVPLLDVNFINPATQSFVKTIQSVLQDIYSTILTLAGGFFGIAVLITAIKLVISSIAAEKAKYKKAIVDWLVGFVMIFCIHYFISFTFYLNEQLVRIASKIVTERLDNANQSAATLRYDNITVSILNSAKAGNYIYRKEYVYDILDRNKEILAAWVNNVAYEDVKFGLYDALTKGFSKEEQFQNLAMIIKWAEDVNISVKELREIREELKIYIYSYVSAKDYGNIRKLGGQVIEGKMLSLILNNDDGNGYLDDFIGIVYEGEKEKFYSVYGIQNKEYPMLIEDTADTNETHYYYSQGFEDLNPYEGYKFNTNGERDCADFHWTQVIDDMIILKAASNTSSGKALQNSSKQTRIISDLASYFRDNAYSKVARDNLGVKDGNEISIKNMLMYAVLVAQSLILFIAYVKRLFYVIMLAMIAPVVVVVDFFQKFGK